MAARGIAKKLNLDRDMVRRTIDTVKEAAPRSKEPDEVALSAVVQRVREETAVEATQRADEAFLLGREVQRSYKALAAGWGLSIGDYLAKMVEFGEANLERVAGLEKMVAAQRLLLGQAARALDPMPIRRQALEAMITTGHRFTREEIDLMLWGEVRGCIRCRGPRDEAGIETETQDARGGGERAGAGARPGGAGDRSAEERARPDADAEAQASAGGAVDG